LSANQGSQPCALPCADLEFVRASTKRDVRRADLGDAPAALRGGWRGAPRGTPESGSRPRSIRGRGPICLVS
jgi:hypothetical protein